MDLNHHAHLDSRFTVCRVCHSRHDYNHASRMRDLNSRLPGTDRTSYRWTNPASSNKYTEYSGIPTPDTIDSAGRPKPKAGKGQPVESLLIPCHTCNRAEVAYRHDRRIPLELTGKPKEAIMPPKTCWHTIRRQECLFRASM